MKKIILGIFGAILFMFLVIAGIIIYEFAGTAPMLDRQVLAGGDVQVKDGIVSVGLIAISPGRFVLVDCGNDEKAVKVISELKNLGATPEDVQAIFLTHGHPDHYNGCAQFSKAEVYALASEEALLEGRAGSTGPIGWLVGKKKSGLKVQHYLQGETDLQIGTLDVKVLPLPGHTDGSAAYLIHHNLYLGDSADSSKDGQVLAAKWIASNSLEQNKDSLVKLASHLEAQHAEVEYLEFAHSAPLKGMTALKEFSK